MRQGVRACSSLFIIVVAPKQTQQSNTWSHFCRELQKQQRLGASQWFHCSSRKRPQSGRGSCRNTTKQSSALRESAHPHSSLNQRRWSKGSHGRKEAADSFRWYYWCVKASSFKRVAFCRESSQLLLPCMVREILQREQHPTAYFEEGTFEMKRKKKT